MLTFLFRAMRSCALMGCTALFFGCAIDGQSDLNGLPSPSAIDAEFTNEYPAVVKVISPGGRGLCSGTFISPKAVLTAAHCTLDSGRYTVQSSFGTFTTYNVLNYGPGIVDDPNDIALLIFDRAVADPALGQVYSLGEQTHEGEIVRIVGFGCSDLDTRLGAGIKRTGTNAVNRLTDYVELITPLNTNEGVRGILGPVNRAGSCFGDSGGPMFRTSNGRFEIVGIAHAGGTTSEYMISEYADTNRSDNNNFLHSANSAYDLGIEGL